MTAGWVRIAFCVVCLPLLLAKRMDAGAAQRLTELLQSVRLLSDVPMDERDVQMYYDAQLAIHAPECPVRTPFYSCDGGAQVDSLLLLLQQPPPPRQYFYLSHLNASDFSPQLSVSIANFSGRLTALPRAASIVVRDSVLNNVGAVAKFLFNTDVLVLNNVSARDVVFGDEARYFSACGFDDVLVHCPIPSFLLPCFMNGTNPPCFTGPELRDDTKPFAVRGASSEARATTCHVPPAPGYECELLSSSTRSYFPVVPGFSTIELVYAGRGEAVAFDVSTSRVDGVLTRIELFDWQLLSWVIALDLPQPPRELNSGSQSFALPPLVTNRVRATFEQWFPPQHAITRIGLVRSTWPELAKMRPAALDCAPATSVSSRSMLDETLADSYCVGRVCQLACSGGTLSDFRFGRAVKLLFLVVESEETWRGGELVATTSANTRVYRLSDSVNDTVPDWGVRGARRVRLVGDAVLGGVPPPARVPVAGLFPGVFVMRTSASMPSGGTIAELSSSGLAELANETVFSRASLANVTFATTERGTLWQYSEGEWRAANSVGWSSLLTNSGSQPPRRKLIAIGDRLLVAIAASTTLHDGSMQTLLVNRRVVQTPIDALDTASGIWYADLLQHRIERNISEIDIAQWNSSMFGIVDRNTNETVLVEWRSFPFVLQRCDDVQDCHTCTTSESNAEPCRWCGERCTTALTNCRTGELSVVDVTMCGDRLPSGNHSDAVPVVVVTKIASSDRHSLQTTTLSEASSALSDRTIGADAAAAATIALAVIIPLGLVLIVLAAIWMVFRSKRRDTNAAVVLQRIPESSSAAKTIVDNDPYDDVTAVRSQFP